jgi:hypothetical protein
MSTVKLSTEGIKENAKDTSADFFKNENDSSLSSLKVKQEKELQTASKGVDNQEENSMSKDNSEVVSTGSNSIDKVDIVSPKDDNVKADEGDIRATDDGRAKNDGVKASLNAIFAKKDSRTQVTQDESKEEELEDQVGMKDEAQDDVVMKIINSEELSKNENEDDKTCGGSVTAAVPEIIIEDTTQDVSQGILISAFLLLKF